MIDFKKCVADGLPCDCDGNCHRPPPAPAQVFAFPKPVNYTVHLSHYPDGKLEVWVDDIADDQRSRDSVAWAMEEAARMLRRPR